MAKFPKVLYVREEKEHGESSVYYVPSADVADHAVIGEKIKVGVYTLTETQEVCGTVETRTVEK